MEAIAQARETIPISQLWGVGSDFDILIYDSASAADVESVAREMTAILNSVRTRYRIPFSKDGDQRALYPLGDVKPYDKQIERATSQGGSTVDFLSFDLRTRELVEPTNLPGTVERLIRGERSFVKSKIKKDNADLQVSLVRGMRPEAELPWLILDEPSRSVYEADLAQVQKIDAPKAIEQFEKAVRNSRLSAGNNHLLYEPQDSLQARFMALATASGLKFPEFLEGYVIPPQGRHSSLPASAFSALEDFEKGLPDRLLYHGTSKDVYIAILRSNFWVSGKANNYSQKYGRGVYTSPLKSVSTDYARSRGRGDDILIPLTLRRDRPLKILDLANPNAKLLYDRLLTNVAHNDADILNFVLARDYGVDVIKADDQEVVILNSEAIEVPSIGVIAEVKLQELHDAGLPDAEKIKALAELGSLVSYLSQIDLKRALSIEKECRKLARNEFAVALRLQSTDPSRAESMMRAFVGYYFKYYLEDSEVQQMVLAAIAKSDLKNLDILSDVILKEAVINQHPQLAQAMVRRLGDEQLIAQAGSSRAYWALVENAVSPHLFSEIVPLIKKLVLIPSKGLRMRLFGKFFGDERSLAFNVELGQLIDSSDRDDLMYPLWYAFSMPDLKGRETLLSKIISRNDRHLNDAMITYVFAKHHTTDLSAYAIELIQKQGYEASSKIAREFNPGQPKASLIIEGASLQSQEARMAFFEAHGFPVTRSASLSVHPAPTTTHVSLQTAPAQIPLQANRNQLILTEVEALVGKGALNSYEVTQRLSSISQPLSNDDRTQLARIRAEFKRIATPIHGYSYVDRELNRLTGPPLCRDLFLKGP